MATVMDRITVDPEVCHGKPCIASTRIMVENILSLIAGGYSFDRILKYYPDLTKEDIVTAVNYAARTIPVWQRNYYEHIVRDETELNRIREYIQTNPFRWHLDRENPQRIGRAELDRWLEQYA